MASLVFALCVCVWLECLLYLFLALIAMAWTSSTVLHRIGWVGILVLFLTSEQKRFPLFTIEYDASYGLVLYGSYYNELPSLCTHTLLSIFIVKRHLILSNAFSASTEMTLWFLSFILLMCYIIYIDLPMWNYACIPGIKTTWSWCMILLICCWIWLSRILLKIFTSILIKDIALIFFFLLLVSLYTFCPGVTLAL